MNSLEIALIIVGIITIIISCIIVDRSGRADNQQSSQTYSIMNGITEEDKKKLMEKMSELLSDISEEAVIRTDDALSKLSNEKIIAVNEFSEQILEKIKKNHEEVVFLYNMLSDKEKELKAAVKEIDSSKKKVQEIIETKANADKAQAAKTAKTQPPQKQVMQDIPMDKPQKNLNVQMDAPRDITAGNNPNFNNNSQILTLYSHGKSIIEISKLLGLGQGEVKLVIDLFKGKK